MSPPDRPAQQAFVQLADTLVADFDVIRFLDTLAQSSVDLLGVTACGIVLVDHAGVLNMVAASAEQVRILGRSQLRNGEGPCLDCYRMREAVHCPDLSADGRWRAFAAAARAAGFAAVHAVPMRLRDQAIGAMNLLSAEPGVLDAQSAQLAQALADVATIGILHQRTLRRHEVLTEQLQAALTSRIVIEQAKGVLAERLAVSVDDAFAALRSYSRDHNLKLADVARAVTEGALHITVPAGQPHGRHPLG